MTLSAAPAAWRDDKSRLVVCRIPIGQQVDDGQRRCGHFEGQLNIVCRHPSGLPTHLAPLMDSLVATPQAAVCRELLWASIFSLPRGSAEQKQRRTLLNFCARLPKSVQRRGGAHCVVIISSHWADLGSCKTVMSSRLSFRCCCCCCCSSLALWLSSSPSVYRGMLDGDITRRSHDEHLGSAGVHWANSQQLDKVEIIQHLPLTTHVVRFYAVVGLESVQKRLFQVEHSGTSYLINLFSTLFS